MRAVEGVSWRAARGQGRKKEKEKGEKRKREREKEKDGRGKKRETRRRSAARGGRVVDDVHAEREKERRDRDWYWCRDSGLSGHDFGRLGARAEKYF